MTQADEDELSRALEEFEEQSRDGGEANPTAWRSRLGDSFEEFSKLTGLHGEFEKAMAPPPADDLPRPFGPYTLLGELGRGAVGIVYEAHQEGLDRLVAVKVLRPEYEADPDLRERYLREARTCAAVRHPHLIEIYEAGEADGRLFYAMPRLEGQTLSHHVREGTCPQPRALCREFAGIAEALGAMHAAQIVHRDVKPGNILMEASGRLVLADFGLARRLDLPTLTQTDVTIGTPLYMSPEQLMGRAEAIDARTDVYALGVSLYEALSGAPPFDAAELPVLQRQILQERPRPLRELVPHLPAGCERIVMKCLEKAKDDRYATAEELAADLRAFADGREVQGRPVAAWRRAIRSLRQPRVGIPAVLVLAGVALFLLERGARPPAASTARLVVTTLPPGEVAVGAGPFEATPVARDLAPGQVRVRLRARGFRAREESFAVRAGMEYRKEYALRLETLDDAEAFARFASAHGFAVVEPQPIASRRGRRDEPLQLVWPRGRMRRADLDVVRVDVTMSYAGRAGRIVFRQAGEEVGSLPFPEPPTVASEVPIPPNVRESLRAGVACECVVVPAQGAPVRSVFEVVAPDLRAAEDHLSARCEQLRVSTEARRLLRAHLWLQHGLAMPAYRLLLESWSLEPARDSLAAARLQREALRMAYASDLDARDGAAVWQELTERIKTLEAR